MSVPPPVLTQAAIDHLVQSVRYHHEQSLTIAVAYLRNGAIVMGTSDFVNKGTYDHERACKVALDDAKSRIADLEAYAIKTRGA